MAVRARGANARAVREVNGAAQLLIDVRFHFMSAGAEGLGIGHSERGMEGTPEHDSADKAAERQECQAECRCRRAQQAPAPQDYRFDPADHCSLPAGLKPSSLISLKVFGTSGFASACGTWQAVQKYRRGETSASICP